MASPRIVLRLIEHGWEEGEVIIMMGFYGDDMMQGYGFGGLWLLLTTITWIALLILIILGIIYLAQKISSNK